MLINDYVGQPSNGSFNDLIRSTGMTVETSFLEPVYYFNCKSFSKCLESNPWDQCTFCGAELLESDWDEAGPFFESFWPTFSPGF